MFLQVAVFSSPAGLKSQEERQKEEIHQFWDCKCSCISLVVIILSALFLSNKMIITANIIDSYVAWQLVWSFLFWSLFHCPSLFVTTCVMCVCLCLPGNSAVLQSGVGVYLCGFHPGRVSGIIISPHS